VNSTTKEEVVGRDRRRRSIGVGKQNTVDFGARQLAILKYRFQLRNTGFQQLLNAHYHPPNATLLDTIVCREMSRGSTFGWGGTFRRFGPNQQIIKDSGVMFFGADVPEVDTIRVTYRFVR